MKQSPEEIVTQEEDTHSGVHMSVIEAIESGISAKAIYNAIKNLTQKLAEKQSARRQKVARDRSKSRKMKIEADKKAYTRSVQISKILNDENAIRDLGEMKIERTTAKPHLCSDVENIILRRLILGTVATFTNMGIKYLVSYEKTIGNGINPIILNLHNREMYYYEVRDDENIIRITKASAINRVFDGNNISNAEEKAFEQIFMLQ